MRSSLPLPHQLLLLALRDEQGTLAFAAEVRYGLAGAIIAELMLRQRITVVPGKKKLVEVADTTPTGDPLLDEALERIRTAKKRGSLRTWVSRLAGLKRLHHRIARTLCERGILREDEDRVLGLFKRKIYPEVDPEPERHLVERLREAVLGDAPDLDPRLAVLVSLAYNTGILKAVFPKKTLKERKDRIDRIVNGELTGKTAKEAIDAMHAVIVAVAATVAITTAAAAR